MPVASARATEVVSCQLSSAVGRPSYSTTSGSCDSTVVTRAPRASQVPGVGSRTVPWRVQARPSALVRYDVDIRSSWPGSVSGCSHSHISQSPSRTVITGSLTATWSSPGSTTVRVPSGRSSGRSASRASIHQCLESGVAQER